MPFQGMDFGSGLGNLGKVLAEGYQARQQLEQQRRAFDLAASNTQYDNLLKGVDTEATHGSLSGFSPVAIEDIQVGPQDASTLQALQQGAAAGKQLKPKTSVVSPRAVPLQQYTPEVDEEASNEMPVDRMPAAEPEVPQDPRVAKALSLGGQIGPNGQILLPNYIANQLYKSKNADIAARTQALIRGAQFGAAPDQVRTMGYGRGAGSGPKAPDKAKQIQAAVKTLMDQRKALLSGAGIAAQVGGYDKMKPELRNQIMGLDQKIQALGEMQNQMIMGGALQPSVAPRASSDADTLWGDYMKNNPIVKDTPGNKAKYLKAIGK